MSEKRVTYARPEVQTLTAARLLESLGPVSCGSANEPSGPTGVLGDRGITGRCGGNQHFN